MPKFDKTYPTTKTGYWWIITDKQFTNWVCTGNPTVKWGSCGSSSFTSPVIAAKGPGGVLKCMNCAMANGHGNPPVELEEKLLATAQSPTATYPSNVEGFVWGIAKYYIPEGFVCYDNHKGHGCGVKIKPEQVVCFKSDQVGLVMCISCALKLGYNLPHMEKVDKSSLYSISIPAVGGSGKSFWKIAEKFKFCRCPKCKADLKTIPIAPGEVYLLEKFGAMTEQYKGKAWHAVCAGNIYPKLKPAPTLEAFGMLSMSGKPKKRQRKEPKLCLKCKVELCEICGTCEVKGCKLVGKGITTPDQLAKVKHLLAETQKARGYATLAEHLRVPIPFSIITEKEDIAALGIPSSKPIFVRPCPVRPRHGFVESRLLDPSVVSEPRDVVEAIFTEARAVDPQAELLVVPYVDSVLNMVITPTRIAIGAGNDGATAGKGSITVPLMGEKFGDLNTKIYESAGVDTVEDDPYFEAVVDKGGTVMFTQLRAGVKIPSAVGDDYIPKDMTVEEVIDASGDLLEWESQVKRIKPGVVVCHVGGSLTSHYGVHCLYNSIPVMTSRRPTVGEFLLAKEKGSNPDPESVRRGLSVGVNIPFKQDWRAVKDNEISCRDAIRILLVALHNAGAMGEKDGFWLGFAAAAMMKVGMAASHGEARHKNIPKSGKVSRPAVYKVALKDFFVARETLGAAQWSFQNLSWSSGYGGPKWAKCTEAILELDGVIREFLNDPSDANIGRLITKLNNAVNQAHNGGWWLNKFVDVAEFDRAAAQHINLIAQAGAGMFRAANAKFEDLVGSIERWRISEPIVVAKGEILAYKGKSYGESPAKPEGIPTCTGCRKEYPELQFYPSAVAEGISCKVCGKGVAYMHDGMLVEVDVESNAENDGDDSAYCCPLCVSESAASDDDDDEIPPKPIEITPNTNVGKYFPLKPEHVLIAAQGKVIDYGYLHIQIKTNATDGYYSYNMKIPSMKLQKLNPEYGQATQWSWAGSDSHEYVTLDVGLAPDGKGWDFSNKEVDLYFYFNPITGEFKDLFNESQEKAQQTDKAGEGEGEEIPF